MDEEKPGYVYILTNPSFREDWVKIGMSSRSVDVRSKELYNTAIPLPFEIYATLKTTKYVEAEHLIHRYIERFTNLRINKEREFFNVKPEEALEIFKEVASVLEDAEIDEVHKREMMGDSSVEKGTHQGKTPARSDSWVWLIPYNSEYFNVDACVEKYGEIYWMQFVNYQTGDTGYLYSAAPESCIRYRFEVIAHDLPYPPERDRQAEFRKNPQDDEGKNHNRFALFRITGVTQTNRLRLSNLYDQGLKMAPRGSLKLSNKGYLGLLKYIEENFVE